MTSGISIPAFAEFEQAGHALGPRTVLVNAAGIHCSSSAANFEADCLTRIFMVTVVGTLLCCRKAVRRMSTAGGGGFQVASSH